LDAPFSFIHPSIDSSRRDESSVKISPPENITRAGDVPGDDLLQDPCAFSICYQPETRPAPRPATRSVILQSCLLTLAQPIADVSPRRKKKKKKKEKLTYYLFFLICSFQVFSDG
jgi:hypothetical protein